jgi:hypothetical protein
MAESVYGIYIDSGNYLSNSAGVTQPKKKNDAQWPSKALSIQSYPQTDGFHSLSVRRSARLGPWGSQANIAAVVQLLWTLDCGRACAKGEDGAGGCVLVSNICGGCRSEGSACP